MTRILIAKGHHKHDLTAEYIAEHLPDRLRIRKMLMGALAEEGL